MSKYEVSKHYRYGGVMHPAAREYLAGAGASIPFGRVVEFGSYDVNGSARDYFPGSEWHGIDIRPGPKVDEVADCREYDGQELFDLVVTSEALEHCAEPWRAIQSAWRALKPGGYLVATMAAPERTPHDGNGDPLDDGREYYKGIAQADLQEWLTDWQIVDIQHDPGAGDLRCIARKPTKESE